MATIKKIIYKCDICGEEFANESDIEKIKIPTKTSDCEGRSYMDELSNVDMCESCRKKYFDTVFQHFAVIRDTLGRIDTEIKFVR